MTPLLVAVALAVITIALLLEELFWQRRQRALAARREVPSMRCLVCPGTPMVADFRTHTRLAHQPRERAAEDFPEWSQR